MNQKERLEYCKRCKHRREQGDGVICSITGGLPGFEKECTLFSPDEVEKTPDKVEQVGSGEAVLIQLATMKQRLIGYLIDQLVMALVLVIVLFYTRENRDELSYTPHELQMWFYGVMLFFYSFCEIVWQRTPGKLVVRTYVVNEMGEKPVWYDVILRTLIRVIPFEWISMLFMPPRMWHDRFSKTVVAVVKKQEEKIA